MKLLSVPLLAGVVLGITALAASADTTAPAPTPPSPVSAPPPAPAAAAATTTANTAVGPVSPTSSAGAASPDAPNMKDQLKALLRADAKNQGAKPAAATPPVGLTSSPGDATTAILAGPTAATDNNAPATTPTPAQVAQEPAVTLPKVEVNRSKITELNQQLHEEDKLIAREAKNTKSTETDTALNNSKVSVAILGGESTDVRKRLASERVELLEFEKSLLEAISRAKTQAEKDELKKQLADVKDMRRNLETPR